MTKLRLLHLFLHPINASSLRVAFALTALGWYSGLHAQTTATYAGRTFVHVARPNANDPIAGFFSGFGRAQTVGDSVVFAPLAGPNANGVFRGRVGPLAKLAAPGTSAPGGNLLFFHDGFARDTTPGAQVAIAAGTGRADAIYLTDGVDIATLLASGNVLPNSGGKIANVIGEPFLAQGELAVIAAHQPAGGGETFRGVYRVKAGALTTVADIATALPGGFGVPDSFSSQVGFDGAALAFWAAQGPFTENEGVFVQTGDGTLKLIARNGDAFPGGGTMDGFISPPFVSGGAVYFFASDTANLTRLLKFENGALTVLAKNGDVTPEGDPLQNLGQFGLVVEEGRVFFPALTSKGAGVYVIESGTLKTVVAPGSTVVGLRPTAIVLQDVASDTIVLDITDAFLNRRLVANLATPAVPVIVTSPTNQTVAAGARVELKVVALGDAPLAYQWHWSSPTGVVTRSTSATLVIESAGAGDVGYYSVTVSNPSGTASLGSFLLNVETAPVIVTNPTTTVVEVGDQLILRATGLGGLPLAYDWSKDGSPAVNDTVASGIFSRTAAGAADAGRYTLVVSNAWGLATSTEVVVTVTPAAPNPVFAGRRFVAVLDRDTTVPGTATKFATTSLSEFSVRWLGSRIVFVGQAAGGQPLGVFAWENGAFTRLLAPGIALANGLGLVEDFRLVSAAANEPVVVRALQMGPQGFSQPVGLYRLDALNLAVIADLSMAVPDGGGAKFPGFFNDAIHAGGKTLFHAQFGDTPALYLADSTGLRRVLASTQDLPVVGTAARFFQSLGFDGQNFVVVAVTAGQAKLAALRVDAAGAITSLLAKGDPLPGTSSTVAAFGGSEAADGTVYLEAFDASFARHVLGWRDGVFTRLAGPGMAVNGLGTVQAIESSITPAGNGKTYLTARLATPQGVQVGIVVAGPGGIEPVLFTSKLAARRLMAANVADAEGDRVLVIATLSDGTRALYANVGGLDAGPLRLEFTRPEAATLRFTVPAGTQLEATSALDGQWKTVPGSGALDVPVTAGARLFRLRRD